MAQLAHEDVPGVFLHGDPGNWNLLIDLAGHLGVLDWENADRLGAPLWDTLLFAETYGAFVAEGAGRRYGSTTFVEHSRPASRLRRSLDPALADQSDRLQMSGDAVASLTLLCWVQQALKEASRLPASRVMRSRYRTIVALSLEQPELYADPRSRG